jgi:hypothetical protein
MEHRFIGAVAGQVWVSGEVRQLFCRSDGPGSVSEGRKNLQDGTALGLFAVRATRVGERPVYVIGGRRLDKDFLAGWICRRACGRFAVSESRRSLFRGFADRSFRLTSPTKCGSPQKSCSR